MKFLKIGIFVGILFAGNRHIDAGGFNIDPSDWSSNPGIDSQRPELKEPRQTDSPKEYKQYIKFLSSNGLTVSAVKETPSCTISTWAKKMGIKGEVIVFQENVEKGFQGIFACVISVARIPAVPCSFFPRVSYENRLSPPHLIVISAEMVKALKKPWPLRLLDSSFATCKGLVYHELGHAREAEKEFAEPASLFKTKNSGPHEEKIADLAIPDEKPVLKAVRDFFKKHHEEKERKEVESWWPWPFKKGYARLFSLDTSALDFSVPKDETKTRAWNFFNYVLLGSQHPSSYSRAYNIHERLRAIEAREVAQLEEHVQDLPISDLVS